MRKVIAILSISGLISFMFSCTPRIGAEVTKGEIPTVAQITSKFSADQLETGKSIWQSHCNSCHKLFEPGTRTPPHWNKTLKVMLTKANLNFVQGQLVRAYLIANSKQE